MASSCFNLASLSAAFASCSAVGAPHCSPNNLQFIAVDEHPPRAKASARSAKIGACLARAGRQSIISPPLLAYVVQSASGWDITSEQATNSELVSPQKGVGISRAFELFFDTSNLEPPLYAGGNTNQRRAGETVGACKGSTR